MRPNRPAPIRNKSLPGRSRFAPPPSQPQAEAKPSGSGRKPADSPAAEPPAKHELPPAGPKLNRADSLPARLPSDPVQRTEVETVRHPITRAMPDTKPPVHFHQATQGPDEWEIIKEGAEKKMRAMEEDTWKYAAFERKISRDPEAMEILKSRHPDYERYTSAEKVEVIGELVDHPRLRAELAQARNEVGSVPNGATGTRTMRPDEQKFLTEAFRRLHASFQDKPFRIHGETAVVGNSRGEITQFNYTPAAHASANTLKGSRYDLHTHPPFMEPFTSSASGVDHIVAAELYLAHENKTDTYVTNGKDVLHIPPHSTELIKLIPDPEVEKELGKFPVAFRVPDPQLPPNPFSNHEAPAAFKPWDNKR
jgi:hypothetical protein